MIVFWMTAGLAAALAGWLVLTGARRGAEGGEAPAAAMGQAELDELDRLAARGLLTAEAHAAARAEAGRRLLADGGDAPSPVRTGPTDPLWILGGLAIAVLAALGLYALIGQAGRADEPYAERVQAWADSTEPLEPAQVAAVLARDAALQPNEPRILSMLGAARFQAGDYIGAASAFRRTLAIKPDDARSWSRLGESLVRSQDGEVSPDAEAAFREAIKLDPHQLGALYFLGDAALKRGDTAQGVRMWTPLLAALEPGDPRRAELETRLASARNGGTP